MASFCACQTLVVNSFPTGLFFEFIENVTLTWCYQEAKLITVSLE